MARYNYADDYPLALDVFFQVVQGSIQDFQGLDAWYSHAHALALKLFRHLSTIQMLCEPSVDRTTGDLIVDHSSVNALNRTAFETFLTFAYIFGAPSPETKRLRYALWQRCGLMERRKYAVAQNHAQEQQLASELDSIHELETEIKNSPQFETEYSAAQRSRLLEKGEWTGVHKSQALAESAGMHPTYFRKIYKQTSAHSHSNYISALQVTQARDALTQQELASYALGTGLVIMTHFLTIFSQLSAQAKAKLDGHQNTKPLFARWHIQREDWDRV